MKNTIGIILLIICSSVAAINKPPTDLKVNYLTKPLGIEGIPLFSWDTMDNRFDYKEWIDLNAMDIVQPDAGVMGLTEAWYVSRMAHLQGQLCAPHNWHDALLTVANASLAAGIPNLIMLETNQTFNPLRTDLFKEPLVMKDGFLELPAKPGFGVEIIDDVEKRFPFIPG